MPPAPQQPSLEPLPPRAQPPDASGPVPTASLLWHAQPDGGWHVDWLVQARLPAGPDDRAAVGWRVAIRPDQLRPDQLPPGQTLNAEPLPPHRALYLNLRHATTLSGDRGTVTPLAWGWMDAGGSNGGPNTAPATGTPAPAPSPLHVFTIRWHRGPTLTYRVHVAASATRIECIARTA